MFLREIVINGFKSFADRTRIELKPGITAIVGPNGCGKSNIVDAIRWVLGEQSAKALRGGSMHDVIFAGTETRKPLAFCEVELTFAECERELGTAFHEVSVLRRVSRDGASDYFLNGRSCRLKDIQRLFMDTGIGRVSYSFMVQGQIDQILSANPAERRTLFEEAAGITRYKARRKEALGRLALVDQNLARATDVLEEITRRLAALKRQAAKALRWRRTQHRLRCLDLASQAFRYEACTAEIARLESTAGTLRAQTDALRNALREREEKLAAAKLDRAELFQKIEAGTQAAFALRSQKESAEAQAQTAELRQGDLRERVGQTAQENCALAAQRAELESRLENNSSGKEERAGDVESAAENYRSRRAEFEKTLAGLDALERNLARERRELLQTESEIARSRADATDCEVELRTSEARRTEIANALAQTQNERATLEARLAEIQTAAETSRAAHARALREVAEAQENAKALLAQFRNQQAKIMQLDRVVARTAAHIALLEQQQAKFEGFSAGAKAILRGALPEAVPAGTAHALNTLLEIPDTENAAAIEALLGSAADAVVLGGEAAANVPAISRALAERALGPAVFAGENFAETTDVSSETQIALPAFLKSAGTLFSVKNAALEPRVRALFARCFVCDSLENFLEFLRENPRFDFLLVVTPGGETLDCRGFVHAGGNAGTDADGAAAAGSLFRRQNEIAALRERLAAENEALTAANRRAMELREESDANDAEIGRRRAAAAGIAQEISDIAADERAAVKALNDNAENFAARRTQLGELEQSRARAEARRERVGAELSAKESAAAEARERIAAAEAQIAELRPQTEAHRNALDEERFALVQKQQQLELFERELAEIRTQIASLTAQIDAREREKNALFAQIAALGEQAANACSRAAQLAETLEKSAEILAAQRAQLAQLEAANEEFEKTLADERETLRGNEAQLAALDVRLTEENSQRNFIAEKVSTEYRLDVAALDWKHNLRAADEEPSENANLSELEDDAENRGGNEAVPADANSAGTPPQNAGTPDWPAILREIAALRERLAATGAVNHTAIDEYSALRERHNFLKLQADDLWNSKNELVKAIDEINAVSQQLFAETFEKIRKNFAFTFNRLFHGGESDLQLVQSDDVLESGIEIVARPPGTKLRNISLLSGGQRTMTAVALLFAIYMVRPSPFCVLDELDAPLDDANVGRFTEIVREFTRFSQFLVVTHNKRTVSAAGTIYGATMQERGVTQLLSMRYNDANEAPRSDKKFDLAR